MVHTLDKKGMFGSEGEEEPTMRPFRGLFQPQPFYEDIWQLISEKKYFR